MIEVQNGQNGAPNLSNLLAPLRKRSFWEIAWSYGLQKIHYENSRKFTTSARDEWEWICFTTKRVWVWRSVFATICRTYPDILLVWFPLNWSCFLVKTSRHTPIKSIGPGPSHHSMLVTSPLAASFSHAFLENTPSLQGSTLQDLGTNLNRIEHFPIFILWHEALMFFIYRSDF